MIDHIGCGVSDYARAKTFYQKALAPLGIKVMMEFGQACGMGIDGPFFWIGTADKIGPLHIAFRAKDRAAVDAFYAAAIAAGGKDNGKPGLRTQYHPNYYGAFVYDPDGNNIEAVHHG